MKGRRKKEAVMGQGATEPDRAHQIEQRMAALVNLPHTKIGYSRGAITLGLTAAEALLELAERNAAERKSA